MLFCVMGVIVAPKDHSPFIFSVILVFGPFDTDAKDSMSLSDARNNNADTLSHPGRLESSATLL